MIIKLPVVLSLIMLLSQISVASGEVYRWVDDNGNAVFGDSPPKDKKSEAIIVDSPTPSGTQFATPRQIQQMQDDIKAKQRAKSYTSKKTDAQCRNYVSQLNKIEIYLEHTPSDLDKQKARDLRKLMKRECDSQLLYTKHRAEKNDWRCKQYREDLAKTEIFLEHTPTDRDKQKVIDLRKQIARECR